MVTGWDVPVTPDRWRPGLKSALMVTSLSPSKVTAQTPPPQVQVHCGVVTETEALGAEEPAASFASTEKLNMVCAVSPFTVKLVPLAVPMELPFFRTV